VAHIGGCRAYIFRAGRLYQITRDHTLAQLLVDEGIKSADEAASHPDRFFLTRWLDGQRDAEFDFGLHDIRVGDRLVLMTNGLYKITSSDQIKKCMLDSASPQSLVDAMIGLAKRLDGYLTCIAADISSAIPDDRRKPVIVGAYEGGNPFR
jgi:protein phosphatase